MTETVEPTPRSVSAVARAIAAGLATQQGGTVLRVTLTLAPHTSKGRFSLDAWPRVADAVLRPPAERGRRRQLPLAVRTAGSTESSTCVGTLAWDEPNAEVLGWIDDLWRRLVAPPGASWPKDASPLDDLWKVLNEGCEAPAQPPLHAVVPTPAAIAGVAFPLERARLLIGHLAAPGAPIHARAGLRDTVALDGRPWLVPPAAPQRLANLPRHSDVLPGLLSPAAADWMAPFREQAEAVRTGRPLPAAPGPGEVASAVLSGGAVADAVFDQMHAAHFAATESPSPSEWRLPTCSTEEELKDAARRRFGTLLSLPAFQRLVGLAIDVTVPLDAFLTPGGSAATGFWEIGLSDPATDVHAGWTLARLRVVDGRPDSFVPCNRGEAKGAPDAVRDGLVDLGEAWDGQARYDLCTIESALACEADRGRSLARAANPGDQARADLQAGGLRIVDRYPPANLQRQGAAARRREAHAALCGAGQVRAMVEDASDLAIGDRLYVGVRTAAGHAWRSPFYRVVRYDDPLPPDGAPQDWMERELHRRLGPPAGERRLELDAAYNMPVIAEQPDGTCVVDGVRGCWTGEPMGFDTPATKAHSRDGIDRRAVQRVNGDLDLSRLYRLPSSEGGQASRFLGPQLRYGWSYHAVLAQVFPAGIGLSPQDAGAALTREGNRSLALPAIAQAGDQAGPPSGRRYLRHNPVGAPIVALPPGEALEGKAPRAPASLLEAVLRTATDATRATPGPVRRVLLAPRLSLQEAAQHDVFRAVPATAARPAGGLRGALKQEGHLGEPGKAQDLRPPVLRLDGKESEPAYYPDPAASFMAVALRLPDPAGTGAFLDAHTVVLPLVAPYDARARWPDTIPVQVIVRRGGKNDPIVQVAPGALGTGKAALPCHDVTVSLQPGQAFRLAAWCLPGIDELRDWFDIVESAAILAALEGGAASGVHIVRACEAGLAALLGDVAPEQGQSTPACGPIRLDKARNAAQGCTGTGGLPVPAPEALQPIAAAVHAALRQRPVPGLVHVAGIDLLHAAEASALLPPALADVRAVRRAVQDPADLLRLLSQDPETAWDSQADHPDARTVVFAGKLEIDTAAFSGVELHVRCAAPGIAALDPGRGRTAFEVSRRDTGLLEANQDSTALFGFELSRDTHLVTWPTQLVRAMRIDGLPLPADGKTGAITLSIAALHAQAVRQAAATGADGLRVTLETFLDVPQARLLEVVPVAISRHAEALRLKTDLPGLDPALVRKLGSGVAVTLRATARPAGIDLHDITYTVAVGKPKPEGRFPSWSVAQDRTTRLVVRAKPPWFVSGHGERLAIVLWPPGLFTRGTEVDEGGLPLPGFEIRDADIGPAGPYVTRWAGTSSVSDATVTNSLLDPLALGPAPSDDPHSQVPLAWLPLPDESGGGDGTVSKKATRRFAAVALRTFVPRFDPLQQLWYFEIDMLADPMPSPTVRLALARYQPNAREDHRVVEGAEPEYLRLSEAITVPVEVIPGRRIQVTCQVKTSGATDVYVTIKGPSDRPATGPRAQGPGVRIRLQRVRFRKGASVACEDVLDGRGSTCVWESWTASVAAVPSDGGWAWSCVFQLDAVPDFKAWSYEVVAEEVLRMVSASQPRNSDLLEVRPAILEPLRINPP